MNNLQCGGAEKALLSLLQIFDYSTYNVDLLLFKKEGVFLNKLPNEVTLLEAPIAYSYFDMPIKKAIINCVKTKKWNVLINRILSVYVFKTEKNEAVKEQKLWKYIKCTFDNLPKKYDVSIGFLEKTPNYFCVCKTEAKLKIGWIHTNYSNMGMQAKYDEKYFKYLSFIATISSECVEDLKYVFPNHSNKIIEINNIVSSSLIDTMSFDKFETNLDFKHSIVTVGRLSFEKGLDLAIQACEILKNKGVVFHWYFIGEGSFRKNMEDLIKEKKLELQIKILGLKENPYPYIKNASIYAQTSRFEGKSIAIDEAKILRKPILVTNFSTAKDQIVAIDEAKILRKPILVTNFSTAKDQIENGVNGLIVAMNPQAIADGIQEMLLDKKLCDTFVDNLSNEKLDTQDEIMKLYNLIEKI